MQDLLNLLSDVDFSRLLILIFFGVAMGIIGGALPGISSATTMALVASFTYTMGVVEALVFLAASQVGSTYGGSISATVLNMPGTPASAATSLEGWPLAARGEGSLALSVNATGSFVGNTLGVCLLVIIMPYALKFALSFACWEMFWFSVFGVLVCVELSRADYTKGLISAAIGMYISCIGLDGIFGAGAVRLTMGIKYLRDGIDIVPIMVGMFGLSEVFGALTDHDAKPIEIKKSKLFAFGVLWKHKWLTLKVAVLGFVIGVIPGVGANIASWVGYNHAQTRSKEPEKFGKGSIEGLIGSEVANNACVPGVYAPLLSLGVPGDGPTAIVLGILTIHGVEPGPSFLTNHPEYLYLLAGSLLLAGIAFLLIGSFLGKGIIRMLTAPLPIIMATVTCLCVIGAYTVSYRLSDVFVMFAFGIIGLLLKRNGFPLAPMILGTVVGGDLIDVNLRRALIACNGDYSAFFTRPISLVLIVILAFLIINMCVGPKLKDFIRTRTTKNK